MNKKENYHEFLVNNAIKSILYEVSTSPKPGLVDRFNNGSHSDMDFFTFISSSTSLIDGFYEIVKISSQYKLKDINDLFEKIRPIGIKMEKKMFKATKGINTHKGIIFSLGIICAVASLLNANKVKGIKSEKISLYIKEMTKGLTDEFKFIKKNKRLTNGEKIYNKYGITGIRGEVESGFETVFNTGLKEIRNYDKKRIDKNKLFIQVLISIMTQCKDSNVLYRHNMETLNMVQNLTNDFLKDGGMYQEKSTSKIKKMDKLFIKKNISPGGSADLLAVSIMFGLIDGNIQ